MQFHHQGYVLRCERVESVSETIERLRRCTGGGQLIAQSHTEATTFWMLLASEVLGAGYERGFGLGVGGAGAGCTPCILPLPGAECVLVGLNSAVVCLALPHEHEPERWAIQLGVPFHGFWYNAGDPNILVLFETGVLAMNATGVELWRFEVNDVRGLTQVSKSTIRLSYMEGELFDIDRTTGRSIKPNGG